MELNDLKSAWNDMESPVKTPEELQQMLKENNHPVLKGIRKQLLIEVMGWSAFLLVYYTMFDGNQKPLFINILLVLGVGFALLHNLSGYDLARHLFLGPSVKASLEHYLLKVKAYARISVISRVLLMAGFLLFFTYNISFNTAKYLTLALLVMAFAMQMVWLSRIWLARLKKLRAAMEFFN